MHINYKRYSPVAQLVMVLCLSFGFMTTIGSGIAWIIIYIYSGDLGFFNEILTGSLQFKKENVIPLLLTQGAVSITGFIIFPMLWCRFVWKIKIQQLISYNYKLSTNAWLLLLLSMFSLIILNLPITEWNKNISFPEAWENVELMLKNLEQQAENQILIFTSFQSQSHFILSIFVLALIPAIGEELLFRGLLQPISIKLTKNHHIGIVLGAFLFSCFHLQFYGFFPRLVFGIFFGYLFYHTQSLFPSIVCHFVNNATTLTLIYLYKIEILSSDYSNQTVIPTYLILMMLIIFFISAYFYINLTNEKKMGRIL